jgi:hypothetical protein
MMLFPGNWPRLCQNTPLERECYTFQRLLFWFIGSNLGKFRGILTPEENIFMAKRAFEQITNACI